MLNFCGIYSLIWIKEESGIEMIKTVEGNLNIHPYKNELSNFGRILSGSFAGLYYKLENIPNKWVNDICQKDKILDLCKRFIASVKPTK
jgi:hypothetical protein